MGDRYVKSDENEKIFDIDANNLYGWAMPQMLPYDDIEMWYVHPDRYMNIIEDTLNTPDDSDIGFFVELDLKSPYNIKEKTIIFPFRPEKKISHQDKFGDYMKNIKPEIYTKINKLMDDWIKKII